ncbi:MAG: hypothetical protein BHV69_05415 [Bacteroidales bacterium 52_46]|nr:MAG: hypothetical protein BHV69_05415 [Bacteroidales bacterium 52_46]
MEIAKFFLFGGGGSFWEHSEISECSESSEEWAEGGGGRRTGQTSRTSQTGQTGGTFGGERVRGIDAMRGCGCSGEQPYFFGGL